MRISQISEIFWKFLLKFREFWQNFDRILMWKSWNGSIGGRSNLSTQPRTSGTTVGDGRMRRVTWAIRIAAGRSQTPNFFQTFIFFKLSKSLNFPFSSNFKECQRFLSFPEHFGEIPAKFHQNFAEKSQNSSKNANEKWNFTFIPAKIWTFFRWNFEM